MDGSDRRDELSDYGDPAAEEAAAAAEAARIGGSTPDYGTDAADHAVAEGGGGEAEGFELAEAALVESAADGEGAFAPTADGFTPELESDLSGAAYGEADEADPGERARDRDPEVGPDDTA